MNEEITMIPENFEPITNREIPALLDEQLAKFTPESIHAEKVMEFDPAKALEKLNSLEGSKVIGADFGGDKGVIQLFTVSGGRLVADDGYRDDIQGDNGDGYLECFERAVEFASQNNIRVGISWGAPLDGMRPLDHPKMDIFISDLRNKYDGDFAKLLPDGSVCINDGPAGLVGGAIEARRTYEADSVIFPINGGGLGVAVLSQNTIYSTEAGHLEGVSGLNSYEQNTPCGVFGASHVCLEILGANKAGIEAQWQAKTGEYMRARDIEDRYKEGNEFAGELYDHSALVVAHMIAGTAKALDIDLASAQTAVVGHGGAFKFPHYGERIQQILGRALGAKPTLIMTKDYGDPNSNACLDGAALAALTK